MRPPRSRYRLPEVLTLALLGGILFSGCAPRIMEPGEGDVPTEEKELLIYFVGIVGPTDLFHTIVYKGAMQAGDDLGVKVVYIYPDKLTTSQYINKIEQAMAARPDGMVLMGMDEKATQPVAERARDQGIVLAFNPAPPVTERVLRDPDDVYISRVGSDEYSAGKLAAEGLIKAGVKGKVFCGIHAPGDGTLSTRAKGLEERLQEAGIDTDIRETPFDPGRCEAYLTDFLRANPDTGGIVTLDSRLGASARAAKKNVGRGEDLFLVGFDLDVPALESIQTGEMLFTIDQQQFWRGYIPILEIVHHIRYGLTQSNYFLSGPNIVDASNVDKVLELTKKGYR